MRKTNKQTRHSVTTPERYGTISLRNLSAKWILFERLRWQMHLAADNKES